MTNVTFWISVSKCFVTGLGFTGAENASDMIKDFATMAELLHHTKKTIYLFVLKPACHHNVWGGFLTGIRKALKRLDESCRYPEADATDATSLQISR